MHINKRFLKKKSQADPTACCRVRALQDDAVERAERLAHGEWLTRRRGTYRRPAVGPAWATPTTCLARRPVCWASLVTGYADGPDIWPSALLMAVGTKLLSCSALSLGMEGVIKERCVVS
jgi:hypothetical protein